MTKFLCKIVSVVQDNFIEEQKMTARNLSVCKASGGFPCISADCMKKARDGTRTREKMAIPRINTELLIFSWANMTKKRKPPHSSDTMRG